MKKILLICSALMTIGISQVYANPNPPYAKPVSIGINFDFFYSSLSPHGEWLVISSGIYAWRPHRISYGWRPYSVGRWAWTTYGWYWDSYEPFGWATYHYGRWYYDDYYGWIWIPDYEWGPSWVEWRYDDYYIGWAPLPPYAVFRINIGIFFNYNWVSPYYYWNFVGYNHFCHHNVYSYLVNDRYRYRVYNNTRHHNDYSYREGKVINNGIERSIIEKRSGQAVEESRVLTSSRLRNNTGDRGRNTVEIYQPSREDIQRTRVDNFEFRSAERRTSLDVSKVETLRDRREVEKRIVERATTEDSRLNRDGESMRQWNDRSGSTENSRTNPGSNIERRPAERPDNSWNENRRQQPSERPSYEAPRRQELPRNEAPRNEAPRIERKQETPQYQAPQIERRQEQPRYEAPKYEAPKIERRQETPQYQAPQIERRQEAPRYEAPRIERRQEAPRQENPSRNENSGGESRQRVR